MKGKLPLWAWGLLSIAVGVLIATQTPADNDGERLGVGIVALAMWLVGITLLVVAGVKAIRRKRTT
jgi:hypothetical protein